MRLTVLAHIRIMAVAKCSSSTTPCTFPSIPLLTRLTVFARFSVEAYYGALFHKKSEPKSVVRQFPRVLQYSRALVLMRLTVLAHMQRVPHGCCHVQSRVHPGIRLLYGGVLVSCVLQYSRLPPHPCWFEYFAARNLDSGA